MNEEQLLKHVRSIMQSVLEKVATSNLTDDEAVESLISDVGNILDQYDLLVDEVIPEAVINHYFGGVDEATRVLKGDGVRTKKMSRLIHEKAVGRIMDDTLLDFKAAIRTAKDSAASTIRNALDEVQGDFAKGILTGDTRKVIQQRVAQSFKKEGLTSFITKDGKKLPLDFYSMTVTRTKMRDASVKGHVERYKENGQDLVQIIENSDSCPICANHKDLVVSLTGETEGYPTIDEVQLPPYHPNCRGGIRPYVVRFKTDAEIERAKKRNSDFKEGKDTRTPAQKRAYEREQEARRKANDEKKQYARWQGLLGDEAPKTLGGFRRMKRQNTVKFQELQSEYRSLAQQISGGGD
ncbi:phage minor capsid protein [Oceanobacillus sp. FSL W7-1281]|uniref:phage minor capsid protein n=1 Tax=Oceanobacillus sp. FSL W7-1281 TaxID=2921698 RepID=UPI0030DB4C0C